MRTGKVSVLLVEAKGSKLIGTVCGDKYQYAHIAIAAVHLAGTIYLIPAEVRGLAMDYMDIDPDEPLIRHISRVKGIKQYQSDDDSFASSLLSTVGLELRFPFLELAGVLDTYIKKLPSGEEFHQAAGGIIHGALRVTGWRPNREMGEVATARFAMTMVDYSRNPVQVIPASQRFEEQFLD